MYQPYNTVSVNVQVAVRFALRHLGLSILAPVRIMRTSTKWSLLS